MSRQDDARNELNESGANLSDAREGVSQSLNASITMKTTDDRSLRRTHEQHPLVAYAIVVARRAAAERTKSGDAHRERRRRGTEHEDRRRRRERVDESAGRGRHVMINDDASLARVRTMRSRTRKTRAGGTDEKGENGE